MTRIVSGETALFLVVYARQYNTCARVPLHIYAHTGTRASLTALQYCELHNNRPGRERLGLGSPSRRERETEKEAEGAHAFGPKHHDIALLEDNAVAKLTTFGDYRTAPPRAR